VTRLLCAAARCAIPRRHRDGCDNEQCRGCLPGYAADGLRLCGHHVERISGDASKAAEMHAELELVLRPSGGGGRTGKPGSASPPRDEIVAMRTEIRHVLVSYAQLIHDERGHALPVDEVSAIATYVATNAEWLAAHEGVAGDASDELGSLASRAWGLAYPSGTRRVEVGPCPLCGGTLTALVRATDALLPSEVTCDGNEAHRWASERWRELDRLVMARRRSAAA
jgi:hypothetical protein